MSLESNTAAITEAYANADAQLNNVCVPNATRMIRAIGKIAAYIELGDIETALRIAKGIRHDALNPGK